MDMTVLLHRNLLVHLHEVFSYILGDVGSRLDWI